MNKGFWLILWMLALAAPLYAAGMKTYYPDGKVQMEISDQGMKTYYENGQLASEVPQANGQPSGIAKYYTEDGRVLREENHAEGTWKQYDDQGRLVAEGKF